MANYRTSIIARSFFLRHSSRERESEKRRGGKERATAAASTDPSLWACGPASVAVVGPFCPRSSPPSAAVIPGVFYLISPNTTRPSRPRLFPEGHGIQRHAGVGGGITALLDGEEGPSPMLDAIRLSEMPRGKEVVRRHQSCPLKRAVKDLTQRRRSRVPGHIQTI